MESHLKKRTTKTKIIMMYLVMAGKEIPLDETWALAWADETSL